MTDKELIQMLRTCHRTECVDCEARAICDIVIDEEIQMDVYVADRLEALLAEGEKLKAQAPKWVSVKERLPECLIAMQSPTGCPCPAPRGWSEWMVLDLASLLVAAATTFAYRSFAKHTTPKSLPTPTESGL